MTLAFLCEAYDEEELGTPEKPDTRTVLRFHPALAPIKAAVLPLSKKLTEPAEKVYHEICKHFNCDFDDTGSIGKRYRRQDEVGTPFCITFDFDSPDDNAVTVRHRDSMEQERIQISELVKYLEEKLEY
jgi:glycyl-tRNA synthetase